MSEQILQSLQPLVEDEQLSALEKLNQYFAKAESWKVDNKTFFLGILRTWYNDDDAIFRQKITTASIKDVIPVLTKIINQSIAEGSFAIHDAPAEIAEIMLGIGYNFSDVIGKILLNAAEDKNCLPQVERKVAAVQYAIERPLNAPPGSINIPNLKWWLRPNESTPASSPALKVLFR